MEEEIDFSAHTEPELVDMFGRMDPRFAPAECARLGKFLAERGYIVTDGETGPGHATPSPQKLQALIGSSHPVQFEVDFSQRALVQPSWLEQTHNDLGFAGTGTLSVDGVSVLISGHGGMQQGLAALLSKQVQLPYWAIVNVERRGSLVRFEYTGTEFGGGSMAIRLTDEGAAARLVGMLPKVRTREFRPQIPLDQEFSRRLIAQAPKTPVTYSIIVTNVVVFIATLIGGADWLSPTGVVQIAWGSNFGPYTTDGEWWRLFTSEFIHFGVIHLVANMLALAYFGPLVERLYGSVNYLFVYLLAGVGGSLTSIAWHPDVNSAGASGAIFGLLGALLATLLLAQYRDKNTFPRDLLRAIGKWALLFLLWNLYAGFRTKGLDYADHIGGLTTGFLIGLTMTRPVTGEHSYTRSDLRRLARSVPIAVAVLAGGLWAAQSAATTLTGDGLYWQTVHWLRAGEHSATRRFVEALSLAKTGKLSPGAFAAEVETDVLPFWRQASARLSTISLPPNSPNLSTLERLRVVADGQARAYALLSKGLRANDATLIMAAESAMQRTNETASDTRGGR